MECENCEKEFFSRELMRDSIGRMICKECNDAILWEPECNRTACDNKNAIFKHINGKKYCLDCASIIEAENDERLFVSIDLQNMGKKKIFNLFKIINHIQHG